MRWAGNFHTERLCQNLVTLKGPSLSIARARKWRDGALSYSSWQLLPWTLSYFSCALLLSGGSGDRAVSALLDTHQLPEATCVCRFSGAPKMCYEGPLKYKTDTQISIFLSQLLDSHRVLLEGLELGSD